jgi:hypothetical protein
MNAARFVEIALVFAETRRLTRDIDRGIDEDLATEEDPLTPQF